MTEIKIHEHRFISLIESEKQVPVIMMAVLVLLISQWKLTHPYKTQEDRVPLEEYILDKLKKLKIPIIAGFNNKYYCNIQFRYAGEYYDVGVTNIDLSTGLSTEV